MNLPYHERKHLNPYDVALVAKNGKQFKAHRQVLSEAGPFFEKLLSSDMKESNEGVIQLEIFNDSQMADILEFIYTGKVQLLTPGHAEDMIAAADYLFLSNLKQKAVEFLEQNTSTSNCLWVYHVAEIYLCEGLIASTRKFINSNFAIVAENEDFMNLPSREVEKWISSDDIVINAEKDVFKIITKWIDYNKSERRVRFCELFRHVRLTCASRDVLLRDVVTNDLVKENKDCLDRVTAALAWIDRPISCDVPRLHSPRKALETNVIVLCGDKEPFHVSFYQPEQDTFYRLPEAAEAEGTCGCVLSCRGKLFFVPKDITKANFYDPDLNRWSPAPWTKADSNVEVITGYFGLRAVLVIKNEICFIVEERVNSSSLWRYHLDANSAVTSRHWLGKKSICYVAVDKYIYAIGGCVDEFDLDVDWFTVFPQCSRFDTEQSKWQVIASLQEPRFQAFGIGTNKKIFVAGGHGEYYDFLRSCEVYNIDADEWHLMGSLTVPRPHGIMMLIDGVLYVLCPNNFGKDWEVECYDHERNEWNVKRQIPEKMGCSFHACSFRLFKGVLETLEPIDSV